MPTYLDSVMVGDATQSGFEEKKFLIDVAEKLCIPAMERAINNFIDDKRSTK